MFGTYAAWQLALALAGGFFCGLITTVASSGAAISLPILLAIGLDPLTANATNRLPIVAASLTATLSFQRRRLINWALCIRAGAAASVGSLIGAYSASMVPDRHFKAVIAAAIIVALSLLVFKVKQAIASIGSEEPRFGFREYVLFFAIGVWLGFIVIDGATFLLLGLTLAVGLNVVQANALKSAIILPSVLTSMAFFSYESAINWTLGGVLSLGSVFGGHLGARLASSEFAKVSIFWILAIVLTAEAVHLLWQFVFMM